MRCRLVVVGLVLVLLPFSAMAQESPPAMVSTYDALADAILALKQTEADFVRSLLQHHFDKAHMNHMMGNTQEAAVQMVLFANEGDNAIAGVRKRLVDGGHHHHADANADEIYEPGYVVVTREAKAAMLQSAAAMRQADGEAANREAWHAFMEVAKPLLQPQE